MVQTKKKAVRGARPVPYRSCFIPSRMTAPRWGGVAHRRYRGWVLMRQSRYDHKSSKGDFMSQRIVNAVFLSAALVLPVSAHAAATKISDPAKFVADVYAHLAKVKDYS